MINRCIKKSTFSIKLHVLKYSSFLRYKPHKSLLQLFTEILHTAKLKLVCVA